MPEPDLDVLRRRYRRFAFPMTAAFLCWYLLYVLLSAYARDLMAVRVVGNVNVALLLGLGQFASTFGIAAWYAAYARRRLDPLADRLRAAADATAGSAPAGSGTAGSAPAGSGTADTGAADTGAGASGAGDGAGPAGDGGATGGVR
ncbi:hypothetical protein GCM10010123_36870 [Pilimelia anulata]|uniref:DUF485 domain-containing protein n=1 Tax=Pilimelia anulata TaxID=53371 RepID=A0A8J3BE01_9ACTN|nr:hypothetical protein GCM10010123_36870 [Pilimelia anulata]